MRTDAPFEFKSGIGHTSDVAFFLKSYLPFAGSWRGMSAVNEGDRMKLSARNQMEGVICEIQKGVTTSVVKIEVRNPAVISASITNDALDELRLRVGEEAFAVIKASDVIIGKAD